MKTTAIISVIAILMVLPQQGFSARNDQIKVKLTFLEALSSKDTTSSLRFKEEYLAAIENAKALTHKRLSKCGYELQTETNFYESEDPIQVKEKAEKARDSWLLVGPRRSNHYLLMAKGAEHTPSVSIMASSKQVYELGSLHSSLSPSNSEMAKAAASEAAKRSGKAKTYYSVVSEDCLSCLDFSKQFDEHAEKSGLKKVGNFQVIGKTPDLAIAKREIADRKPEIILVPNYSKVSSHIIADLSSNLSLIFVGGDGWGDSRFGFIRTSKGVSNANGFTVRGFPPVENGLKEFRLGKDLLKKRDEVNKFPTSASAVGIMKSIDSVSKVLCDTKPKTASDFKRKFYNYTQDFSAPWGVSIYDLQNGEIIFKNSTKTL